MLVVPPPTKPTIRQETRQKPRKYFTIHENSNNVLAFKGLLDNDKTTVMGFVKERDAVTFGRMVERHYLTQKDWPDLVLDSSIKIYSKQDEENDLKFLHAVEWSPDDVTLFCAARYMDLMHIDGIVENPTGFTIRGSKLILEGSTEFYKDACDRMWNLVNPTFTYLDDE